MVQRSINLDPSLLPLGSSGEFSENLPDNVWLSSSATPVSYDACPRWCPPNIRRETAPAAREGRRHEFIRKCCRGPTDNLGLDFKSRSLTMVLCLYIKAPLRSSTEVRSCTAEDRTVGVSENQRHHSQNFASQTGWVNPFLCHKKLRSHSSRKLSSNRAIKEILMFLETRFA